MINNENIETDGWDDNSKNNTRIQKTHKILFIIGALCIPFVLFVIVLIVLYINNQYYIYSYHRLSPTNDDINELKFNRYRYTKEIRISNSRFITDVISFTGLYHLTSVSLYNCNNLDEINGIELLDNLQEVSLSPKKDITIFSLSKLKKIHLNKLSLSYSRCPDIGIDYESIMTIPNLNSLEILYSNQINKNDFMKIIGKMPLCNIYLLDNNNIEYIYEPGCPPSISTKGVVELPRPEHQAPDSANEDEKDGEPNSPQ